MVITKSRENSGKSISSNLRQSKQLSGIALSAQAGLNRGKHAEGFEGGLHSSQDPDMINTMTHSATFNNYKRHV